VAKTLYSGVPRLLSRAVLATSAATLAVFMTRAHAAGTSEVSFDIPAQSLSGALLAFSRQTDVVVTAPFGLVQGKQAPAVDGRMPPNEALRKLLSGSGLKVVSSKDGALVVQSDKRADPPIRLATRTFPGLAAAADEPIQPTTNTSPAPDDSGWALQEVIVTARRRSEALEDVPQTVSVISADAIQKLNILNFQDLQTIVPGLAMSADPAGLNDTITLRGLTYSVYSQDVLPSVGLYINDSLLGAPQFLFQSMYDIGQIEVLRGPQGTLHGEPAPSGAITLTTRRPDLSRFGGYADVTGYSESNLDGPGALNAQAAINAPIIKDVLALRLAGVIQDNHLDLVHSLYNPAEPFSRTKSGRATLTFEPIDALSATFMYQHLEEDVRSFPEVIGPGSAGGTFGPPPPFPGFPFKYTAPAVVAAGYNGPPITAGERLSVENAPNVTTQKYDLVTGQVDYRFAGQRLAYVGNYSTVSIANQTAQDIGNLLPGNDYSTYGTSTSTQQVHELRLMSEERLLGLFDYTLGASYRRVLGNSPLQQFSQFLPGTFGTGAAPNPYVFNPADVVPLFITTIPSEYERSVFFNGTMHLGDSTELSAGVRRINFGYNSASNYALDLFGRKIPLQLFPNSSYSSKPSIYDISLAHHFTDRLMVYATTGSAWRPGTTVLGPQNATNDPTLNSLINLHSEYSHSYELGIKSLFLDRRAQVNLAVYHQYFGGLVFQSQYAPYLIATPIPGTALTTTSIATNNFSTNANSVVNGVDMDGLFRVTPRWTVGEAFSYSNGHVDNAKTPCTPAGVDINDPTVAAFKTAVAALGQPNALVYECNNKQTISTAPSWNASVHSEYSMPLAKRLDGYLRGLLTYYPSNPNALQGYDVPSYALINIYVGARDPDGSWELSLFAKNLTNRLVLLNKSYFQVQEMAGLNAIFGNPGYYNTVQVTPPRQVGLNLRYTIGSR
jgi:outer membrane receptor protein involved in Fe transport